MLLRDKLMDEEELLDCISYYKGQHYSIMLKDEDIVNRSKAVVDYGKPDFDNRVYLYGGSFDYYGVDLDNNGIILGYNGQKY